MGRKQTELGYKQKREVNSVAETLNLQVGPHLDWIVENDKELETVRRAAKAKTAWANVMRILESGLGAQTRPVAD